MLLAFTILALALATPRASSAASSASRLPPAWGLLASQLDRATTSRLDSMDPGRPRLLFRDTSIDERCHHPLWPVDVRHCCLRRRFARQQCQGAVQYWRKVRQRTIRSPRCRCRRPNGFRSTAQDLPRRLEFRRYWHRCPSLTQVFFMYSFLICTL